MGCQMRSEHKLDVFEQYAFVVPNEKHWHPGQRKRIKRLAHQRDRRAAKQNLEDENNQKYA